MPGKRILVVEDEPKIMTPLIDALKDKNLDPSEAATISEARDAYRNNTFDAIILDVMLPDGNGMDFCEEIRLNDPIIPIIFTTARDTDRDEFDGLKIGAFDYVKKPYNPVNLALKIKNIVTRLESTPSKSNSLLYWDEGKKRITFKGEALKLAKMEYKILKYLINNSGAIHSRDQIMQNCWPEETYIHADTERVVDVHIKTIRNKLKEIDPEVGRDILVTHIGMGYSVEE